MKRAEEKDVGILVRVPEASGILTGKVNAETKYHDDAGDWYVAIGWDEKKAIVKMDSVLGTITEIKEI